MELQHHQRAAPTRSHRQQAANAEFKEWITYLVFPFPVDSTKEEMKIIMWNSQFGLILDHANILPDSDTQLHALHMH